MKVGEARILDISYRLFKEKGVRSVTLKQIARGSQISLWDLNLKFKSKKDLILALVKRIIEKKSTYLFINSSLSASAVAELTKFFRVVEESVREFEPIFQEVKRYDPVVLD